MNLNEVSSIHSVAKKHLDNLNTKKVRLHNEQRQPTYDIAEDIQKTKETELDIQFSNHSIEDRQGT
jgi:hypothetical protein